MAQSDRSPEGQKDANGESLPYADVVTELYRQTKPGHGPAFVPSPDPPSAGMVSIAGGIDSAIDSADFLRWAIDAGWAAIPFDTVATYQTDAGSHSFNLGWHLQRAFEAGRASTGTGAYVPEQSAAAYVPEQAAGAINTDQRWIDYDAGKAAGRAESLLNIGREIPLTVTEVKPHRHGQHQVKGGETVSDRVARTMETLTKTGALAELRSDDPRFLPAAEVLAAEFCALGIDPPSAWSDGYRAGQNDAIQFEWRWLKRNRQLAMALARLIVDYESACTASAFDIRWMLKRLAFAQLSLNFFADAPTPLIDPDAPKFEQRNAQLEANLARMGSLLLRIAETAGGEDRQIMQTRDGFDIGELALEAVEHLRVAYVATGQPFPPFPVTEAQAEGGQ